jgi:RNA polymerase sigma factor for flagellar operon FliA
MQGMGMQQKGAATRQPADGDRNEALLTWYPMVQRIAHRVAATYGLPVGVDTADLVSSGVLGLAQAYDRFDPERGVAFEAFAIPRVKGAIVDAIRASDWVPRKARLRSRMTGEPLAVLVSIDEGSNYGDGDRSTADRVCDKDQTVPGDDLEAAEGRRELVEALNRLPERERLIVTLHYFEGVALQEIARSLGVTESRVSQLHTRALKIMRGNIETTAQEPATAA